MSKSRFYIGTYTSKGSKGIYTALLDENTGEISEPVLAAEVSLPSYLALSPCKKFLYSVSEKEQNGTISAFSIEEDGKLKLVNCRAFPGGFMCYVNISPDGKTLAAASYREGKIISAPILPGGGVGEMASLMEHKGSSVNPNRQGEPHAHCSVFDNEGNYLLCADLGTDKLYSYRVDKETSRLSLHAYTETKTPEGEGPRHVIFNKAGDRVYVITELLNRLLVYAYDKNTSQLTWLHSGSSLPPNSTGEITGADIHLSLDEKYVYLSNRQMTPGQGGDSLAAFSLEQEGEPALLGVWNSGGAVPRGFAISKSGKFLVCANQGQEMGNIVSFPLLENGKIGDKAGGANLSMPVCIKFL